MRRLFYVTREMCGGADLPSDFDLDEFCEVLQGKLQADIEVVPSDVGERESNRDSTLVSHGVFLEALGEYCHR